MELYLLRHGIAAESDAGYADEARPLTLEGAEKTRHIARALRKLDLSLELILSSPLVRARQTAEIVASELGLGAALQLTSYLAPESTHKQLLNHLRQQFGSVTRVLLVGHEPFLSTLISRLISGKPDLRIVLKKGGFAKLDVPSVATAAEAKLECLLAPKHLLRIADADHPAQMTSRKTGV